MKPEEIAEINRQIILKCRPYIYPEKEQPLSKIWMHGDIIYSIIPSEELATIFQTSSDTLLQSTNRYFLCLILSSLVGRPVYSSHSNQERQYPQYDGFNRNLYPHEHEHKSIDQGRPAVG